TRAPPRETRAASPLSWIGVPMPSFPDGRLAAGLEKRLRARRRREVPLRLQVAHDLGHALFDRLAIRVNHELRPLRRLVGGRDARELRNLSRARLLVEALHVAALAGVERRGGG